MSKERSGNKNLIPKKEGGERNLGGGGVASRKERKKKTAASKLDIEFGKLIYPKKAVQF